MFLSGRSFLGRKLERINNNNNRTVGCTVVFAIVRFLIEKISIEMGSEFPISRGRIYAYIILR